MVITDPLHVEVKPTFLLSVTVWMLHVAELTAARGGTKRDRTCRLLSRDCLSRVKPMAVLGVNLFTTRSPHLAATCSLFLVECERDAQTDGVAVVT